MLWYIQTVINLAAVTGILLEDCKCNNNNKKKKKIEYIIQLETITRIIRTLIETMNYKMDVSCISGFKWIKYTDGKINNHSNEIMWYHISV